MQMWTGWVARGLASLATAHDGILFRTIGSSESATGPVESSHERASDARNSTNG
jgi:hypothetical protein